MMLLYSPRFDQINEELEYPNQFWHHDDCGRFLYRGHTIWPTCIKYTKWYWIGSL